MNYSDQELRIKALGAVNRLIPTISTREKVFSTMTLATSSSKVLCKKLLIKGQWEIPRFMDPFHQMASETTLTDLL